MMGEVVFFALGFGVTVITIIGAYVVAKSEAAEAPIRGTDFDNDQR